MKKIYFVLSLVFLCAGVSAQVTLPHLDPINYTPPGPLQTQTGWTVLNTGDDLVVAAGNLTFPGLATSTGNKVTFDGAGIDAAKLFTQQTTGTVYYSFLIDVTALGTLNTTGSYLTGFTEGTGTTFGATVWTRSDGAGYDIGINPRTTAANTVWTTGTTSINNTVFVVISYQLVAGTTNDVVKLWINPTPGAPEPAATLTATNTLTDLLNLNRILIRQSSATETPFVQMDELRIGTTWADVTPTVAGTPNIIVTPTSLTGFNSLSGVPSVDQNYTVSGTDLTADISIAPPAGFEISTTNAPFTPTNPITLTQTGGIVTNTTIYARMNSVPLGLTTGNITHTSAGSNNPTVALTGHVLAAEPTTQGIITISNVTNSTMDVSFTAGDGAKQVLAIHAVTPVANHPADGTTYAANPVYGLGANLGANTYVVYNGVSGNGGAPVTVSGLTVGVTYHFALYEYNDGGVGGAENYLLPPAVGNATTLTLVNTYVWTGVNGTSWTDPLNWLPVRTFPATNDSLLFELGGPVTVTNVPAQTIGYLGVTLGTIVNLQAAVNNTALTIGGTTLEDLKVEAGSQLNISTANGYSINLATGAGSIIDGDITFTAGAHRLTAADAFGITFNSGSSFTMGAGTTGAPFGTGTANSVSFVTGSVYTQIGGSNPFQLAQPASVVVFNTGSLFKLAAALTPSFSGRTYADFELDITGSVSGTGTALLTMENVTITNGTITFGMTTAGFDLKGNVTVAPGATLNFAPASVGVLNLNGTTPQIINNSGTLTWNANQSLTVNNAAGVELNSNITLGATTTLALTAGILKLNAPATMLTLSAGTALTGGNSNASYVDGKVRKIGNTDFTFPIGKTGFGYVPIRVSNFVGGVATDQFDAEYLRGNARLLGPILPAALVDHVSGCDWWTLDRTNGTPTVDVTAFWSANNVCTGTYIDNLATLALVHFDGVNWNSSSVGFNPFPNGTIAAGDITWPSVTTFSPFAFGSTSTDNPLPITINYFTGLKQGSNHLLNWKVTCTNTPTVNIVLERSSDARNYASVYSVTATALQCQQPFNYTDAGPAKGVNYYRLKLTDANGKVSYSSVVNLINAASGIDILNISPNPIVGGTFSLKLSAAQKTNMELLITDMQGRMIQKQVVNAVAGFNQVPVDVRGLAAGTYQLVGYSSEGRTRILRFVIQ